MKKLGKFILLLDIVLLLTAFFVAYIYQSNKEAHGSNGEEGTVVVEKEKVTPTPTPTPEFTPTNSPITEKPVESNTPSPRKDTVITFTGDVLLTDYMINNYKRSGIKGLLDENLYELLNKADINMINQEFPFSNRGTPMKDKEYTFRTSPQHVNIFQEMGVDIVSLANNHALDYGIDALLDTFTTLDEAGIKYVGAGENKDIARRIQYFNANGYRIAFVGATRVIPVVEWNATDTRPGMLSTYDPTVTCELIKEAKKQADYVVVYVHWGIEHQEKPALYQQNMGKQYIDSGADIVVGTHTHCLQGVEFYKDRPIVYSLGNFIFSRKTTETAMIKLVIDKNGELNLAMYPCEAVKGLTSMVTDVKKIKEFNQYMESISYGIEIDENQILRISN